MKYEPHRPTDRFFVSDERSDGHSAILKWHTGDHKHSGVLWDHDGSNNGGTAKLVDLPKGKQVFLKPCIGEWASRRTIRCGPERVGRS